MSLPREWQKKLAASGFVDIERTAAGEDMADYLRGGGLKHDRAAEYAESEEYYRRARQFLHAHRFASPLERRIWAEHAEGTGYREIATKAGTYVRHVHVVVVRLKETMLRVQRVKRVNEPKGNAHALLMKLHRELERMDATMFLTIAPVLLGGRR